MPGLEKLKEDVSPAVVHNGGGSSFDLSGSYSSFQDENDDSTKKSVLASSEYKLFSSSPSKMKKEQQQQQKRNSKMSKSFDTMTADFDDDGGVNNDDYKTTSIKNGKKSLPKPFAKKQKSSSSSLNNSATLKNGDATIMNGDAKTSFKKKSTLNGKNKDDPFRFAGDGVDFKCKLIGFQEVNQPRGDQMCQDAIQTCKAIVKRKGEHKQRIVLNISLEGLKIKDGVSGMVLHSFPVSKVSFIAKDTTDNRAFGFIYGVSDHEHHFYAVKTEKTADSIVFSIRDMFQIVYEMKKKQVEQAKQSHQKNGQEMIKNKSIGDDQDHKTPSNDNQSPVANLLDLETELENLEQGMQNMKNWVIMPDDGNNTATAVNRTNNQFSSSDTTSSTWAT
uniref:PID domain-containing protein n=1 Tax=Romanomermis culicivorax TaxID=13658 RepID=A0A915HFP5_ROMCU